MKKIFVLFFALATFVVAKAETVLWNGTYTDGVELNSETVATFKAGNTLRVYVTVPEGGANFKICYKGDSNGWAETTIPSIDAQWPWVNGDETYKDFTLTEADITALSGMNIYIYKGENSEITKVSLLTEEEDEPDPEPVDERKENLWTGSISTGDWGSTAGTDMVGLSYGDKGSLANAMMTDSIMVTYTVTASDAQVYIQNPDGWTSIGGQDDNSYDAEGTNSGKTFVLAISDASTLEIIQQNGILVRGKNITITAVDLYKAVDRYDAVPLIIGEDGIATFGSSKHLDFSGLSDNVTAYYVSTVESGKVTMTPVSTTRGWTGYVVKGTAGSYSVPVIADEPEWVDAFNNLRYTGDYDGNKVYRSCYTDYDGSDDNATKIKTYYRYILAKDTVNSKVGFFKLATNYETAYIELGRHMAYLETASDITPTGGARVALAFGDEDDDDETTAINTLGTSTWSTVGVYNLNGQLVGNGLQGLKKGIYVVRSQGKDARRIMVK